VVFVHGLGGARHSTWKADNGFLWLEGLSKDKDLQDVGIWTYGYSASPSEWTGQSMPLPEQAKSFIECLKQQKLHEENLIFVGHSLGGLLIKQMLRAASSQEECQEIARQTRGVEFLATPHTGSSAARVCNIFKPAAALTETMQELQPNAPFILDLGDWYREHEKESAGDLATLAFNETQPMPGLHSAFGTWLVRILTIVLALDLWLSRRLRSNWLWVPSFIWFAGCFYLSIVTMLTSRLVVDEASANPGHVTCVPVVADHVTICKPVSIDEVVYTKTRGFINSRLDSRVWDITIDKFVQEFKTARDSDARSGMDLAVQAFNERHKRAKVKWIDARIKKVCPSAVGNPFYLIGPQGTTPVEEAIMAYFSPKRFDKDLQKDQVIRIEGRLSPASRERAVLDECRFLDAK
jgi:pimeloyl-ACP methyl ester carboxylesterase